MYRSLRRLASAAAFVVPVVFLVVETAGGKIP